MAQPAFSPATLPTTDSLLSELAHAVKKNAPLLVMVSLEGCPFCKVARENYLGPLREQQGLLIFQVDMRSKRAIKNFAGLTLTQDELIRSWGVKVAPTVLFFGRGGLEIAERLVGGYIPDFYGAYLDERLQLASAALRR
jgi:thioredoxin-related protein